MKKLVSILLVFALVVTAFVPANAKGKKCRPEDRPECGVKRGYKVERDNQLCEVPLWGNFFMGSDGSWDWTEQVHDCTFRRVQKVIIKVGR